MKMKVAFFHKSDPKDNFRFNANNGCFFLF